MQQKPDLPETTIANHIQSGYDLKVTQVVFLPLGYDVHTAVYRVETSDGTLYFLKLRKGDFDPIAVLVPRYLSRDGIHTVISPLPTRSDQLFGKLKQYTTILYPFIPGLNGYKVALTDDQWLALGQTLRSIHESRLPADLLKLIPKEIYDSRWRRDVSRFLDLVDRQSFTDPISNALAQFMRLQRGRISQMVIRAEALAGHLKQQAMEFVLCHCDAHPGNYLVASSGDFYLVDWDHPMVAPREHDLMFFSSGVSGDPTQAYQERLFYQGYGPVEINQHALAYYRYERIIQDISEFCKQIFLSTYGHNDRQQSLDYLVGSFDPGNEVEAAYLADPVNDD